MKRRGVGVAVLVGTTTLAGAQMLAMRPVASMIGGLQDKGAFPVQKKDNPLQPTGFGSEQIERNGNIPDTAESKDKGFQILRAGSSKQEGDFVSMSDGTEFMYQGYHIFANGAEGSLATHIFSLVGDVKVIGKDALVSGERVTVDFDRKIFHAVDSSEILRPSLVKGQFVENLYSHGRDTFGSQNEHEMLYGGITSCDLLRPHYEIDADSIIVRPAKRIIFRKARVRLFGRTIIKIPYLSIPLDDKSYNNTPIIGQSPQEGYYAKFRYSIPLPGDNDLRTHLDLMSKLGIGIGEDWLYRNRVMNGELQVYTIEGPGNMLKIADDHKQQFKWGTLALTTDYENNNYLINPGAVSESIRALLTFPQHNNALTKLTINQSSNSANGYTSTTQEVAVNDTRKLGDKITTNVNLDYQNNGTSFQGQTGSVNQNSESLNVKADVSDELAKATADLAYQRTIPIGSTAAVFGTNDETPVISLTSDAKRLVGGEFAQNWPFKTYLSLGQFSDELGNSQVTRSTFDIMFNHPDHSTGPFHSDIAGEFRQGVYSDGTAQYVLNFSDIESYKLGKDTSLNFRYNYLRPYGYSPVAIDQTGQQNVATADLSVKPIKSLSIGAQSGFDLLRLQTSSVAWQPVGVRMEYNPANYFQLRAQSTYDTFQGAWSNVRVDMSYKPGATFVSLGAYYDGIQHTWTNVNMFLDGLKIGKMKISAILTYDGYLKQFDTQQYSVTYDLHCAEAVFTMMQQQTGFEPGTTFSLFIRLKAFPFSSPFGTGTRGQPIGTGTGTSN